MIREQVPDEIQARMVDEDGGGSMAAHQINWTRPGKVSDDELLGFVAHQYRTGKARRYEWERDAAVQLAWAKGHQHLVWSDERHQLIDGGGDDADLPLEQRQPITINRLRGFVLAQIALTFGGPLTFHAYPQTNDNDDVANARTLGKLVGHYMGASHLHNQSKLLEAAWILFCTGFVCARVTFDPFAGGDDVFDAEMMREDGEEDSPETRKSWTQRLRGFVAEKRKASPESVELEDGGIRLPKGEVDIEWLSGFDVTEPLHARNVHSAPWMMVSRFRSLEWCRQRYGEAARQLAPSSAEEYRRHHRYEADFGRRQTDEVTNEGTPEDVLIHELWRPRIHGVCPQGFLGIVGGNRVLKKTAHPYVHGRIPLVRFTEIPDADSFRPPCTIRDLMSLQRNRNQTRSLLAGYLRFVIDPRIMAEKGSGFPEDAMSKWPKVISMKDDGINKVRALELPPPPAFMDRIDQADTRDMEDVANIHRSSMGQSEGASQSGKHALAMQAGDQLVAGPTRTLVEEAASEVGSQLAALIWEFYEDDRTLGILGERGEYQVLTFKGRSLMSRKPVGPHSANVRCVLGKQRDPKEVLELIRGTVEIGLMDPKNEAHRATLLRWINEQVPPETDEAAEHRSNAARENEVLLASPQERAKVRVAFGDDDATHIREHERQSTTARYRTAVEADKTIGLAYWTHVYEHLFNMMLKQMQPEAMKAWVAKYLQRIAPLGVRPPSGAPPGAEPPPGAAPAAPIPGNGRAMPAMRVPPAGVGG